MQMILSTFLCILFSISVFANEEGEEEREACGKSKPFSSYEFRVDKMELRLPNFFEVVIDGKNIYSSKTKLKWNESNMAAQYFKFKSHIFIQAFKEDCIDLIERKLLSIDAKDFKSAKVHDILTGHYKDAFFTHNDVLFYWSEWFCMKESNKQAKENGAYLFKFAPAKGNFEKIFFKQELGCYPVDIEKSLKQGIVRKTSPKIVK